ncbi:ERI1 exoribonuclease 2-like isoform X2 [Bacillus rossius redtenbacheri]|uniref:ERI1 exoribonuclease 2-like isoform X2 n=1 Tax=Bacillus rossius redtenbacheri TaxID=93214 RepID=UPI002FDDD7CD
METGSGKNCINTLIKPTITLAKKLGLIEVIYIASPETDDTHRNDVRKFPQEFDYLIVVDFESTCWEGNRSGWRRPEIIEFPAVLLNLSSGDVEDEFQQYVSPSENQKLSEFCKTLTGITQQQVDDGVPLATCLVLFNRWILQLSEQKKLVIHKQVNDVNGEKSCTFVTWSDWDFSSCLHNECRRKQISKPEIFNKWIDLRAIYREFYKRSPKGLRGALHEVGLAFEGREHSGLHDARNTAHLAWRMACDGAKLGITKTLLPNVNNYNHV